MIKGQNAPARPFLCCHFCTSGQLRDAPFLFSLESLSIATEIESFGSSVPVLGWKPNLFSHKSGQGLYVWCFAPCGTLAKKSVFTDFEYPKWEKQNLLCPRGCVCTWAWGKAGASSPFMQQFAKSRVWMKFLIQEGTGSPLPCSFFKIHLPFSYIWQCWTSCNDGTDNAWDKQMYIKTNVY